MSDSKSHCPDPETLGSFFEGTLDARRRAAVAEHLEHCTHCLEMMATLAELDREEDSAGDAEEEQPFDRRRPPYIAAAALLFCLAAMVVVWMRPSPLDRLRDAAGNVPHRITDARLVGFPWAARPDPERGGTQVAVETVSLRGVAADVQMQQRSGTSAGDAHLAGVTALVMGRPSDAVAKFETATAREPDNAAYWTDLAAAHMARGRYEQNHEEYARAFAAAHRALRTDPNLPEALFNRALALDALGIRSAAANAWRSYLRLDASSEWAGEARSRLQQLEMPTHADEWKNVELPRLREAARNGDASGVAAIVARFPELARRHGEVVFPKEWADAFLSGNEAAAAEALRLVRMVADALRQMSGEGMLGDAITAVERCSGASCAALAQGHVDYYNARGLYRLRKPAEALVLFRTASAQFALGDSPMQNVADYYIANCLYDANDSAASHRLLDRLLASCPPSHRAFRAHLLWQKGTLWLRTGALADAQRATSESIAIFEQLREPSHEGAVRTMLGNVHDLLGHSATAWNEWSRAIAGLSASGEFATLQKTVDAIAEMAWREEDWLLAVSMFSLSFEPELNANPRLQVTALVWSALAAHRLGWTSEAEELVRDGRRVAEALTDAGLRASAIDDVTFAEATIRSQQPARAAAAYRTYIANSAARNHALYLPEAHLGLARALRAMGEDRAAEPELVRTIRLREREGEAHRPLDAYFRTSQRAAKDLADVRVRRGDVTGALAVVEDVRARGVAAVPLQLPPRTLAIEYVVRDGDLLIFAIDGVRQPTVWRVGAGAAEVERAVALFTSERSDPEAEKRLYRWLVAPFAERLTGVDTLVIVTDPILESLPFAALRNPADGAYLIESAGIIRAASIRQFVAMRSSRTPVVRDRTALVVGNPFFNTSLFPDLEMLPAAEREAQTIAKLYPRATLLTGRAASDAEVRHRLGESAVVHIAAHAVVNRVDAANSYILFAPSGKSTGALSVADVSQAVLANGALVVLAGCRTADRPDEPAHVSSLALAFVQRGARNVIGTVANVADGAAAEVSILLHRNLARGLPPAAALSETQRECIRSGRVPAHVWGAFQIVGSGI
jgi:CHAT domain-containing protein/tetratricopeptide (TPR) repeat protein